MDIFFIRHGESHGNACNDYTVENADSLSGTGLEQAARAADRLAALEAGYIYCSPLKRAVQTVMPYAVPAERAVELWPELVEGCWQPDTTVRDEEALNLVPWDGDPGYPANFVFRDGRALRPGNETYSQGIHRFKTAVRLLLERHAGTDDRVLVAGHGFAIARIMELLLGIEPVGRIDHDNTGISHLADDGDGFRVKYVNRL